jgi:peptidyl-tRNA hydrolase ICT1
MYPVKELLPLLPQALHKAVRSSRYYTASSDALTFHAQTSRSRGTNLDNNRKKLEDEISRIYREMIPGETSAESKEKHKQM